MKEWMAVPAGPRLPDPVHFGHICRLAIIVFGTGLLCGCVSTGPGSAPLAGKKEVMPKSGLAPCSERMSATRAPRLEPGLPAQQNLKGSFGAERLLGVDENVTVLPGPDGKTGILRVRYPKGSINFGSAKKGRPLGGAAFYAPFGTDEVACVHYKVRFPERFEFVKGGKLPGLYGGEAPSGGEDVTGMNGWSVRLMWRKDGAGELYEYIVNKREDYGLSVGRGAFTFPRGHWVTVDLEVELNKPGRQDGVARLWIDGKPVIEQNDIIYWTGDKRGDGGLMFSTFFGGSDDSWASPKDQYVDFTDFRLYAKRR